MHAEVGARPVAAVRRADRQPHGLGKALDDGEAQPGAAAAIIALAAGKAIEQRGFAPRWQAGAGVAHRQRHPGGGAAPGDGDGFRREFGGIADQVDEDVVEQARIGIDQR